MNFMLFIIKLITFKPIIQ